ncbi:27582_t:CDS:2, partial [Gigaspora margarita]
SSKKAEKWPLLSDNDSETQLENNTKEIAYINLIEYISNKISNLEEGSGISFNLCIELDNNTLTNAHHDTKLLVKLIINEIEEGDRFTTGPTNSVRHSGVSKFYLACSQCYELECEYKESNRKKIDRFDCYSKLTIDVTTREEIKCEIMHNLYIDPVQLRTHIRQRFDALQVTPKQIYYWWSTFNQQFFKLDENPFISTHRFLDNPNNNSEFCYEWNDETYQPSEVVKEFSFINPTFKPDLNQTDPEYYIICPIELQDEVVSLIKKHFNMHQKIPVNTARLFLTTDKICISTVCECMNSVSEIILYCFGCTYGPN